MYVCHSVCIKVTGQLTLVSAFTVWSQGVKFCCLVMADSSLYPLSHLVITSLVFGVVFFFPLKLYYTIITPFSTLLPPS